MLYQCVRLSVSIFTACHTTLVRFSCRALHTRVPCHVSRRNNDVRSHGTCPILSDLLSQAHEEIALLRARITKAEKPTSHQSSEGKQWGVDVACTLLLQCDLRRQLNRTCCHRFREVPNQEQDGVELREASVRSTCARG